ncbi:MAG TPA: hypothetical protein DD381_02055 [Lentisphaeria bacterium]|uniref:Uncharacterized protein n=1 Tax=Candidatus Nomurabacteria bacterium GW2011_GWE1_35_16 TaxID=1618761 RepID=A0A0G0BQB6_9BACT|nr:MAG: hypothetical protein UR55_C0017G0005 [Candidatus Nomurabacteria bacterium GW2011_GWF1_34_20]KKP61570.1 MAG: hypothetical protein UR57_C0016G0005 [Candidatus Nomurabacteria bacterium GW2011_GWE2_34_25]KKP65846.1 MAG: hypothetical protein UR64_C0017G0005 [Candidatus Nomurabacteria bacterium GW2011_GWE1_35_16]KKP82842.1 MAG: hypothetical protein UR85_C0012G0011 [Candidatus Nomurabacteria bacterium GW2011_GWF2_35_66]HAX65391.1 hypothetical protein [Candidatus Nomurabacteria bacterium]HBM15
MNATVELPKSKVLEIALSSKNYTKAIEYLQRNDVEFIEALNFIKRVQLPKLWEKVIVSLRKKSKIYISGKTPEEKIEIGRTIHMNFFWKIIVNEPDVQDYLQNLSFDEVIAFPEKMNYVELWKTISLNSEVMNVLSPVVPV